MAKDHETVLADFAAKAKAARNKKRRDAHRARQRTAPGGAQPTRRVYHEQDLLRVVYMAGEGKSAGEIVGAIGGTTRWRVYALLRKLGIALVAKPATACVVRLVCERHSFDAIARVAIANDLDPLLVAGRLLDEVAAEPALLRNLVEELDPRR